jgi:hypothetical protein
MPLIIRRNLLLAGSVLMAVSYFLPWVTLGNIISGYELAEMYERMNESHFYLRFTTVPKVALGIFIFYIFKAPRTFVYYVLPVFSLVPLVVLNADIFAFESIHYGFYLLHLAVIITWIGAFTYKSQTDPVLKSAAKE